MNYSDTAKNNFEDALKLFKDLGKKSVASKIEQVKLCILCQKYLDNFVRWLSCSPCDAKAYQVFVKSTILAGMLELPQAKWHKWISENANE